jgi:high-affinity Fe2+/Pb2+ permease
MYIHLISSLKLIYNSAAAVAAAAAVTAAVTAAVNWNLSISTDFYVIGCFLFVF